MPRNYLGITLHFTEGTTAQGTDDLVVREIRHLDRKFIIRSSFGSFFVIGVL